jgi:CRP/FNR family transcriptional regulator
MTNVHQPFSSHCTGKSCAVCEMRHVTFCAVMDESEILKLSGIAHHSHSAPHQLIFQEGDPARDVFNVLEGTVKLYKSLPDGRTQIVGFLFPGDFLGLSSTNEYAYSAEAIDKVKVCRFERRQLTNMFGNLPKLVDRLLRMSTDDLSAAQEQMLLLGRKTAREKVLSFLVAMSERAKKRGQSGNPVVLTMSRAEIADYLGLTVETVSRTLTKLREEGVLKLPRPQEVVLLDTERFLDLAIGA